MLKVDSMGTMAMLRLVITMLVSASRTKEKLKEKRITTVAMLHWAVTILMSRL